MNSKRVLISVYDKEGVVDFARGLKELGWELISTGGTKKTLEEANIDVLDVQQLTGFPEVFDGRVKTLCPQIFAGILYRRSSESDQQIMEELQLSSIDMVVNTLYPFVDTLRDPNSSEQDILEKIDIGGPSMIRGAAKNHRDVIIVTSIGQYNRVLELLRSDQMDERQRKSLAAEAFAVTAAYEIAIANHYAKDLIEPQDDLFLHYTGGRELRYGENPQQRAKFFRSAEPGGLKDAIVHQGKALSYNNLLDASAAIEFIREFQEQPTAIAIKHTNPCGIASAENLEIAYQACYEADSESIFGGIVVVNGQITSPVAEKMTEIFLELVIAPSFTEEALGIFRKKPNLRVIEIPTLLESQMGERQLREVSGGMLQQDADLELYEQLNCVTKRQPTEGELEELLFAYRVAKCVKSNGIAITKNRRTIGLGVGQVNRYFAVQQALKQAGENAKGGVVASDGFFPFADSIRELAEAGIQAVIQPGGSIKDQDSIEVCDEKDMTMVYTAMRHFRH
ncbi:MAG: bifunctional phosphoribosylaminoimidazolecarboxamide formyltransferase/IMP cyclohydrolase [Tissierellia bacterium]|nr:bifunctional phosphoribosylaminoimidazolecarboxamide formyltransferase/IMP cyclohydrolase [Tissierellia bacterium]